ncbi:MAG: hypothetical protein H0Z34_09280 [Brevibacillus sp.]|nr:hypothetical protein [Brevibacillus sp.]
MIRGMLGMIATGIAVTAIGFMLRPRRRSWFRFGMNRMPQLSRNMMNIGRSLAKALR